MTEVVAKTVVATGVASSAVQGSTPARTLTCRVLSGDDAGAEVQIGARPVLLGSDPACDLVLADRTVSRRHAELQVVSGGLRVRDLGSTNGSFSGNTKITDAVLPPGGGLRFGDVDVRINPVATPGVDPSERERFGGLLGRSTAMREVFAVLELAAGTDATVLIEGESGTGKEGAARAIHDHSARASKPFVIVDCGATNTELIDSQLFGHKAGAFTGAQSDRRGAFVEADGGTIFLDELGELALESQVKLLRVLEAGTVQALGSDKPIAVDVRVVAATNRSLQQMVDAEQFRFDLFYRVAVVHLRMPPLRERPEDVVPLVVSFFEGRGIDAGEIGGANLEQLQGYGWPGNVRELRNVLERSWVYSGGGDVLFTKLQIALAGSAAPRRAVDTDLPFKEAKAHWVDQFERDYLERVFAQHEQNLTRAAEHAGLSRQHFRELLHKHGLQKS